MTENRRKMLLDFADEQTLIPNTVKPLYDFWLRDTHITLAADGNYYCTGTTRTEGEEAAFLFNDGIRVWKSPDLENWEDLGLVWSFEKDGTWENKWYEEMGDWKEVPAYDPRGRRALYAPEIYQIKGDFYITASINWPKQRDGEESSCTFLLKSTTGKAEGPYVDCHGGPMSSRIDSSIFTDDDGTVYYLWQDGKIARMKDDMTGFAEPPCQMVQVEFDPEPYCEGVFMFKHNGFYNLCLAIWTMDEGGVAGYFPGSKEQKLSYDCVIATSKNIYGPYSKRYTSITGGGHNSFFTGKDGKFYATMFGNPVNESFAPFYARPAVIEMEWDGEKVFPKR
jgi:beta-xylosidase